MISLILSIRFWTKTEDRQRGIAAIVVSGIAALLSICLYGLIGLVDVGILIANIIVYLNTRPNDEMFTDDNEMKW
jgi:hypothetical protein